MREFATHLAIEVDAAMSGKCVFLHLGSGLRGGIRTPNNPSRNRGLYPVELHAECHRTKKESGGSSRIRTCEGLPLGGLANPCFQPLSHGSVLVDVEGFEPTEPFGSSVFKTVAFSHSANLPCFEGS